MILAGKEDNFMFNIRIAAYICRMHQSWDGYRKYKNPSAKRLGGGLGFEERIGRG